ncbi:MAG: CYTH and CHAD domain-containing protein [Candidatus Accumulibacter sp.]|jgi:inorganic triphosphatase YgiF|nr:CYTH and CHAD domain-containing protein [Accumulibacter sp.]
MPSEIELKLGVSSGDARRLAARLALVAGGPRRGRLFNTYYDTPALDLWRRGVALRFRRKGNEWLMTVKSGDPAAGGLARRQEWEAPARPGVFDFAIVTDDGLRAFLESRRDGLLPVFSTDFTRAAWIVERSGARVEVAIDRGRIEAIGPKDGAAAVSEAISELELELVEGPSPDALFEIAIDLAAGARLHPMIASKAERGYALAAATPASPARAGPSPIEGGMSPGEAFRAIALDCLTQLQRNEQGIVHGGDAEYLHQARIAIRRLRSAFRTFAPALSPAFVEVYAPRWGALGRRLGGTRDWDVFLAETLSPLENAFPGDADLARLRERALAVQSAARTSAVEALSGPDSGQDYSRLLLAFSAALFRCEPPTIESGKGNRGGKGGKGGKSGKSGKRGGLREFARRRLGKRLGAVRRVARKPARLDEAAWHRLRLAFKRLRYALEFFAPLLPRGRLRRYLEELAAIQDLLGKLNDQTTAGRLIGELHPEDEPISLAAGWIAGRKHLLIQSLADALAGFFALREPW